MLGLVGFGQGWAGLGCAVMIAHHLFAHIGITAVPLRSLALPGCPSAHCSCQLIA